MKVSELMMHLTKLDEGDAEVYGKIWIEWDNSDPDISPNHTDLLVLDLGEMP